MTAATPSTAARERPRPSALALTVAGSASVATAFGMARYGYGLLLPDIKGDVALGEAELGAIGTLAYVAYMTAALAVGPAVRRHGPRATVVAGGALGVTGTIVIALCGDAVVLATGVGIAGASAGLVYPPFADALRGLPDDVRGRALASINCGTGWGVAVAAPIAIVVGSAWRDAYLGFAACALLSTAYAARTLPAGPRVTRADRDAHAPRRTRPGVPRRIARPGRAASLIVAGAFLVGLGSGAFWTFAVQQVRDAGLDMTSGRILLGVAGIGSLVGVGAADLVGRLGLRRSFIACVLLEALSIGVLAVTPATVPAVLLAAFTFGVSYNTVVAVSVLALTRLRSERPSSGVALVAGGNAAGLLFAPVAGGALSGAVGLPTTLGIGAAIMLAAAAAPPAGREPVA